MDVRRALLLFAIVLAVAAIASSVARPPERDGGSDDPPRATADRPAADDPPAAAEPVDVPGVTTLTLGPNREPKPVDLEQGAPATLVVSVDAPGDVEIPSLGLVEAAEPLTPARFDILQNTPGTHAVLLRPATSAGDDSSFKLGALRVRRAN